VTPFAKTRLRCFAFFLACLASLLPGLGASAFAQQAYPARSIHLIVPFAAGGSVDSSARIVGAKLAERLSQQVVIENRGGAGGSIGSEAVARAAPDGYTVLWGTVSTHAINGSLFAKLGYDNIKDFIAITELMEQPLLLVVPRDSKNRTLDDIFAEQKAKPNTAVFGSAGVGTTGHLTGELLKQALSGDMQHVPYKGSHPMLTDLIGGRLNMGIDNLPSALAQVKAGTLKAIAITSRERSPLAPDVPALSEKFPGFQVVAWQGLFAPAGTPEPIIDRLSQEVRAVLADPVVSAKLREMGTYPVGNSKEEFAAFVNSETRRWADIVKKAGIKPQ
jgi:tripartite-type tricarboxylate transporter receptor subunit TctC